MKRIMPFGFCILSLTSCSVDNSHYNFHRTLALVVILVIITLFGLLALYSNLLRDEVSDCSVYDANAEKLRKKLRLKFMKNTNPFSLSRVQLAVWTVIISCSYIYLQLCMPVCTNTDVNQTALILMGISAAVTTAGTIMDKREIQDARDRHQNTPSEGFFVDILSDDNGISIHRFQNVIWTGIAMIIYLNKIYAIKTGCTLPELDETLLALTGISSATYLAVKSQENNPAVEDSQLPGANQPVSNSYLNGIANIPAPVVPVTSQTMVDEVNATASSPANSSDNNGGGAV
jgi:hypothetical protein